MGRVFLAAVFVVLCVSGQRGFASTVDVYSLGDQDFVSDTRLNLSVFNNRTAGDPVPFNRFSGSDRGSRGYISYTHNFASSAVMRRGLLRLSIYDHDSFLPGQDTLDIAFDGVQQDTSVWEGISIAGQASIHVRTMIVDPEFLSDGSLTVLVEGRSVTGHGQSSNGLGLDFSELTLVPVPLPASGTVFLGLWVCVGVFARRARRIHENPTLNIVRP